MTSMLSYMPSRDLRCTSGGQSRIGQSKASVTTAPRAKMLSGLTYSRSNIGLGARSSHSNGGKVGPPVPLPSPQSEYASLKLGSLPSSGGTSFSRLGMPNDA